jgi:predicted small integral membrane protein
MLLRYLKIDFVILIALLCLFYAGQNVANLSACFGSFEYVLGSGDHVAYSKSIFPAIESVAIIWTVLVIVVGFEFAAGLFAAKGAWDMWSERKGSAEAFNASKTNALVGCGLGIIIWLGFFGVFGGALFQMWQTEIGSGSMDGAFQVFVSCAAIFLITSIEDS